MRRIFKSFAQGFHRKLMFLIGFLGLIPHSHSFIHKWLHYWDDASTTIMILVLVLLKNHWEKYKIIFSFSWLNIGWMMKGNCIDSLAKWRQIFEDSSLDPTSPFQSKVRNESSCWNKCQIYWKTDKMHRIPLAP